eukprot:g19571.t1
MAEDEQEPDQSYWAKGKGKPKGKKGGKFKSKGKFKFGKDDYDSKGKDGKGKSKIKACKAAKEGRIKPSPLYNVVAHRRFIEGLKGSIATDCLNLIRGHIHLFSPKQQKQLQSDNFELFRKYAPISVLDSDDDEDAAPPLPPPPEVELFGENSKGRRLSDLLCQSLPALQAFAAAAGLSEETAFECMERMAKSSEEAMIKTREKESAIHEDKKKKKGEVRKREEEELEGFSDDDTEIKKARILAKGVERRIDPADGQAYTLEEFIQEYGGSGDKPPVEWDNARHTSFVYKE